MMTSESTWAAGLFEGEGTVRINKATKRNMGTLVVSISNTDRQIIAFFQDRWPGSVRPVSGLRPQCRDAWVWIIAARRAAAFLVAIRPFVVTDRVRQKIEVGLQFQAGKRHPGRGMFKSEQERFEYRQEQHNAWLWMRHLNARGRSPAKVANA